MASTMNGISYFETKKKFILYNEWQINLDIIYWDKEKRKYAKNVVDP